MLHPFWFRLRWVRLLTKKAARPERIAKAPKERDDLFEMANLFPEETGLLVTVWVSPRGRARHAARVKVCRVPGNKIVPSNTAVVRIAPEPTLIAGDLPGRYLEPVVRWVGLNQGVLLEYLDGKIGTGTLMRRLQTVSSPGCTASCPRTDG
jgi:hypothetical protein